jgi:hypothetical protein
MAGTRSKPAKKLGATDSSTAVDAFMATLDHPHKAVIEAARRVILGIDPAVAEGIKWNAPSFRTREYFATTHLRAKAGIGFILHLGAKVRELPPGGLDIDDPGAMLRWLGPDRAQVVFADIDDFRARQALFERLLRSWIRYV